MQCVDKTKRPAALYITQENDMEETMGRYFSYCNGFDDEGKVLPTERLLELFKENRLYEGKWAICMKYRPKNSISTADIESIINEVEADEDVEVKILVHDYIKRIKPEFPTGDVRIDLGEVANDFSTLAKSRKIPVITANQLNRQAYGILEETTSTPMGGKKVEGDNLGKKKLDQGRQLNANMISESQLILENVDIAFGSHREEGPDGKIYLAFKKFKDRSDRSGKIAHDEYFVHPFEDGNGMRLLEDVDLDKSMSLSGMDSILGYSRDLDEDDDDGEILVDDDGNIISGSSAKKAKQGNSIANEIEGL